MAVYYAREANAACDVCNESAGEMDITLVELKRRLRLNGWTFSQGQTKCPSCSRESA